MFAIDCGNSRIKWARLAAGGFRERGVGPVHDDRTYAALGAALSAEIDMVFVANVAGAAVAERIAQTVADRLGIVPEFVRVEAAAHGIECAYREPATLGVDRWLAMIAARRRDSGPFAVVGAGTAVTFDAVAANGRHLGGLILPGDALMIEALAARTQQIGIVPRAGGPGRGVGLLGSSTAEAVGRGSRLALAAAIDRAVGIVAESLAVAPRLLITGGDADAIVPWLESKAEISADLVLEGLAAVAGTSG